MNSSPNIDELVSAYLDAKATAEQIEVVESSAELMARVELVRNIQEVIGDPAVDSELVAPPETKQRHIATALDLFDQMQRPQATEETTAATATEETTATRARPSKVVDLVDMRTRRRRAGARGVGIAAAAAALVIGLFAATLFQNRSSSDLADAIQTPEATIFDQAPIEELEIGASFAQAAEPSNVEQEQDSQVEQDSQGSPASVQANNTSSPFDLAQMSSETIPALGGNTDDARAAESARDTEEILLAESTAALDQSSLGVSANDSEGSPEISIEKLELEYWPFDTIFLGSFPEFNALDDAANRLVDDLEARLLLVAQQTSKHPNHTYCSVQTLNEVNPAGSLLATAEVAVEEGQLMVEVHVGGPKTIQFLEHHSCILLHTIAK